MKELSIEKKAKRYDETLEQLKGLIEGTREDKCAIMEEDIIDIFPELKESEDEKIRKGIIELVKQSSEILDKKNQERMLAWLDKQGKEEYALKSFKDEDVRKFMQYIEKEAKAYEFNLPNRSYDIYAFAKDILYWLEKQGAQKEYTFKSLPRLLEMVEPTERAKAYCQKLIDTLVKEGYATDAKIVGECLKIMNGEKVALATMDEKQGKPKWSEEDEEMLSEIITDVKFAQDRNPQTQMNQIIFEEEVNWLNSLKQRIDEQQ